MTPVATTRSNPQNPYLHARAPPQPLMQQRVTGDVVPETQGSTATASGKEGRGVASVGTYHHVDASEQSKKAPSLSRILLPDASFSSEVLFADHSARALSARHAA